MNKYRYVPGLRLHHRSKNGIIAIVDFITEEARETSHKVSFQAEAVVQGPGCVSVLLAWGREHHLQHMANLYLILVDAGFGSNSVLTAPLA